MMHEMNGASSKKATQDRAWELAERIESDDQRQTQVCEILTTEANSLPYFQAAWMKRQLARSCSVWVGNLSALQHSECFTPAVKLANDRMRAR